MSADAVCQQCGAPVAEGSLFCAKCGADVTIVGGAEAATVEMPSLDQSPGRVRSTMRQMLRDATLGEYEILDELGRGGMATVFLAHDISLDRKVAIKVMAPHLLEGEGMAERFKLEARTAAQLSHPHIIPIYAVKETESSLFFVMKYVEGKPLDDIIKKMGPMPIPMVKDILTRVGGALGYAHRRNVVHRDVKPANVMIDEEGNPIMTDFGIAKVAEAKGLTMTGTTIGTPSYMSPEQCEAREVTGASDQYSLGIVAWEMLTGKVPFAGDSAVTTMYKQVHEELPPLQDFRPDVPPEVLDTVTRMLEKKPEDRWPSLEAAIRKLESGTDPQLDPIRNQLLELARDTDPSRLLAQLQTPGASLPKVAGTATTAPGTPAGRGRKVGVIAAVALVVGLGGGTLAVLRPWAGGAPVSAESGGESPAAAPPTVADEGRVPAPTQPVADAGPGGTNQVADGAALEAATGTAGTVAAGQADGSDAGGDGSQPAATPPPITPPAAVASLRIDGDTGGLEPGDVASLSATPLDAGRHALSGRGTPRWQSSDRSVGTVSSGGEFTALAAGSTTVTAELAGIASSVTIDVAPPSVSSLALDRTSLALEAGQRGTLVATARSRSGATVDASPVSWSSSEPSVASVQNGEVTAAAEGQAIITATAGGRSASATVTVTLDTRSAIEQLIAAYAAAIESKDLARVKAAYPGMTTQQEDAFKQSLPSTQSADLTVESVDQNGQEATAHVKGTYVFVFNGRRNTSAAEFDAVFHKVNGRWQLDETRAR